MYLNNLFNVRKIPLRRLPLLKLTDYPSVFTTVLANRLATTIPAQVPPALTNAGLPASSVADFMTALTAGTVSAFSAVQGLTPAIQAAGIRAYKEANSDAFRTVFLVTLAFSGTGMLISLFYPDIDHLLTKEVSVQIHKKGEAVLPGKHDDEKTTREIV